MLLKDYLKSLVYKAFPKEELKDDELLVAVKIHITRNRDKEWEVTLKDSLGNDVNDFSSVAIRDGDELNIDGIFTKIKLNWETEW